MTLSQSTGVLKHSNTKTAIYILLKTHWVIALFKIFGPVGNKWLVTVSLDHPVLGNSLAVRDHRVSTSIPK